MTAYLWLLVAAFPPLAIIAFTLYLEAAASHARRDAWWARYDRAVPMLLLVAFVATGLALGYAIPAKGL